MIILANPRQVHKLLHPNAFQDLLAADPRAFQYSWSAERSCRDNHELCPTDDTCFCRPVWIEQRVRRKSNASGAILALSGV